jgi:leucyl aminopeptidase
MHVESSVKCDERSSADVVVVPFWEGKKKGELACKGGVEPEAIDFPLSCGDFHGKEGETLFIYLPKGKEKRALLLGLGKQDECNAESLRRSYAKSVKALRAKKLRSANFLLAKDADESTCQAIFEGVLLACYTFDEWKTEPDEAVETIRFCGVPAAHKELLHKIKITTEAVNFVRDLVNRNADDKHTGALEKIARELQKTSDKIKTSVLDKKQLEELGMGLHLAVGRGAVHGPALVIVHYKGGGRADDTTAIIGKGITFDTGGLNLKPTGGIETMKCDMAGAAATLGVIKAAAQLKLKRNLIGVLAIAENAIGPMSYKPGDVFRSYSGKSVEISNTDAEGRLVLADALSYIQDKYKPSRMIDLATLTGGIVVALGEMATGLFSNNDALAHALEAAASRSGERLWRMPLYPEYKELLHSSIADLKNSGGRMASAPSAAMFLKQFVKEGTPWAHLDIAGTAYLSDLKLHPYHPTLATGVCVRLLIDYLEAL